MSKNPGWPGGGKKDVKTYAPLPKFPVRGTKGEMGIGGKHYRCQYIIGDTHGVQTLYCGKTTSVTESWCEDHKQFVFNRVEKQNVSKDS